MSAVIPQLIRSFSDDLQQDHPGDILGRGLSTAVAIDRQREKTPAALRDQWDFLFAEGRQLAISLIPNEEAVLLSESRKLYKAWTKFCESLPPDQQIETSQEIPSLKLLHKCVSKASTTWIEKRENSKTGRVKRVFTRLCETLQSHSKIVSMIPTNDKYVTLLTGSLSAIASACTNHEKLASGVSDSLEELSDDMAYWNDLIGLFPDQGMMQRYIMELYTVVFEFLTEIFTGWSKSPWTRFVASFNEQAFNKLFVEKRKRIKAMEHNMERHANIIHMQSSLNSQRDMGHQLSEFQTQVHTFTQVMQRLGTDVQSLLQANTTQMMSNLAIDSLDRSLEHPVTKLIEPEVAGTGLAHVGLVMDNTVEDINNNVTTDTIHCSGRCSVRDALALLEPIATQYNNSIQELVDLTTRALTVSVDLQIKRHLEAWKSSMTGNRIWVQGPHDVSHPSQNTLTAACLVGLANNAKIPFLSYFCSLKQQHQMSSPGLTPPDILLDMVKSLIVQLLLRQTSDAFTIDIPLTDFDRLLTGSDLDTALDVLHKLRGLVPSYCLCVIESVDVLEDRSDVAHTANLREVLREVINLGQPLEEKEKEKAEGNEGDSYKTVKILLTSNGHVDVLAVAAQGGFLEKIACDGDESGDGEQLGSLWDDDARSEEGG